MSARVAADEQARPVFQAPVALSPPHGERPALAPSAYYTLAPAAVMVALGSVLISLQDPTSGNANREDAGEFLIGAGSLLTVAFPFVLGAQVAKRRRWDAERRWDACAPRCDLPEPRLYHSAYMLVPGVVMSIAGLRFMAHNWRLMMAGEGDPPAGEGDPPPPKHHFRAPYVGLGTGTVAIGTTLFAAGLIHLIARSKLQTAWQRRMGTLSEVGVQPTMAIPSRAAGSYAFGLAMNARF